MLRKNLFSLLTPERLGRIWPPHLWRCRLRVALETFFGVKQRLDDCLLRAVLRREGVVLLQMDYARAEIGEWWWCLCRDKGAARPEREQEDNANDSAADPEAPERQT